MSVDDRPVGSPARSSPAAATASAPRSARALVARGAFVWVNDIYEDRAAAVAADLGGDGARRGR